MNSPDANPWLDPWWYIPCTKVTHTHSQGLLTDADKGLYMCRQVEATRKTAGRKVGAVGMKGFTWS